MVRIVNGIIVESEDEMEEYEANDPLMGTGTGDNRFSMSSIGSFFMKTFKEIFTLEMNLCGFGVKFWIIAVITIIVSLVAGGPWTLLFNCVFLTFLFFCIKVQNSAVSRMRESQQQQQQQQQQPNQQPYDPRTTVNSNNTMVQNPNAESNPPRNTSSGVSRGRGRGNVFTLNDLNRDQDNQANQ